jgi:outer membrane protein assembly factor BamB
LCGIDILEKSKMKILVNISIVLLLLGSLQQLHAQQNVSNLGDIIWQIQIPDNPGTTLQDKQVRSLKQIPDVNGDNVNDVIVATGNYWTICYSGLNGTQLWRYSTHFGSINTGSVEWEEAVAIADVNNDGTYDAVIGCGGGNEMVYALNGSNGNVIWAYGNPNTTSDGDIEAVNIRYDFNRDGIKDVIVSASGVTNGGRHAAICLNAVNGQELWYRTQPEPFTDDAIGTESGAAIGVNNNGAPYVVRGLDTLGNTKWNYTSAGNTWSLKEMPDVDTDGKKDIIGLGGFTGYVFALSGTTGTQIWARALSSSNNGKIQLLDDADGNGYADFSLSAPQVAYRIDTRTGNTLWSNSLGSSYLRGIDDIGDVTGDTIHDIVVATQTPARLLVLNGVNGNILFEHVFGATLNQRGDRAAVLKDIDTNGVNEFLGGNREGKVICFYGGNGTITSVNASGNLPADFSLSQNYPNPFNPNTTIRYSLAAPTHAKLFVYDIMGREVAKLVDERKTAGNYEVEFDAGKFSSGVYLYKLTAEGFSEMKRMILVK